MDLDGEQRRAPGSRSCGGPQPERRRRPRGAARVPRTSSRQGGLPRRRRADGRPTRRFARRPDARRLHARSSRSARAAWAASGWRGAATAASRGGSPSSCSTRASSAAPARSGSGARARSSRGSSHPQHRRLLDAGVSPSGPALPRARARRRRAHRPLLRLAPRSASRRGSASFSTCCAAVAQAHANLIVHRDIKPSNVLVTADGAGQAARLRHREAPRGGDSEQDRADRAHARGRPRA